MMQNNQLNENERSDYRETLRSTSLIGGASLLNILIGMVRTKFVASLLGPAGVGLLGMFTQVTSLVTTVSGMGLASSGVRQVAEAVGSEDDEWVSRTIITLRRVAWVTGGLGTAAMFSLSEIISQVTFGSREYSVSIALLSITILLTAITAGQTCILRGTRRIGDLAKINVLGALSATFISIPCFYIWGQEGIAVSLILYAVAFLSISWWFARRVPVKIVRMRWSESRMEARKLLVLGVSFMGAGVVAMLSNYLIRVFLVRGLNLEAVGIYQAAFSLSGILVSFILSAMGTDFYPRLTSVEYDNFKVTDMVNKQTEIMIFLALPGLTAMMLFAPIVIELFYSKSFIEATPLLRWFLIGTIFRVFSWPLNYTVLAKGKGRIFFIIETLNSVIHVTMVCVLSKQFGIIGAGVAFLLSYIFYTVLLLFVVDKIVGFTWNIRTIKIVTISIMSIVLMKINTIFDYMPTVFLSLNCVMFLLISVYCSFNLLNRSGIKLKIF